MTRYRKRPVVIDAILITHELRLAGPDAWPDWMKAAWSIGQSISDPVRRERTAGALFWIPTNGGRLWVVTLEGPVIVEDGAWLIRGIEGELYPCRNDIFLKTYEEVLAVAVRASYMGDEYDENDDLDEQASLEAQKIIAEHRAHPRDLTPAQAKEAEFLVRICEFGRDTDGQFEKKEADMTLTEQIVWRLNHLIEDDDVRKDIERLIETRIPCSAATRAHPHIIVMAPEFGDGLGFLGLLNGIIGVKGDFGNMVSAMFSDDGKTLLRFAAYTPSEYAAKTEKPG